MEMHKLKSSAIDSVGYDAATRTMHIKFTKGATYEHKDVPPEAVAGLKAAKSAGAYHAAHIAGKYNPVRQDKKAAA